MLVEKSGCRWRGGVAGGGKGSQVEGSDRRWRGAISGGVELSQAMGSGLRLRGAISDPLHSTCDRSPPPATAPLHLRVGRNSLLQRIMAI